MRYNVNQKLTTPTQEVIELEMEKRVLITQSNYIPWKGYFDAINLSDEFIIFDEVQFTRRDWRNRNRIVTPNGVRWLTIPVTVKGKFFQKINETVANDPNWRQSHWSSIQANYRKAPFFKEYSSFFEGAYLDDAETNLSRINESLIRIINKILGIETRISRCEDYGLIDGKTERIIDLCRKVGGTEYLTGPAARSYLDESQFKEAGISVIWMDYSGYPPYPQQFGVSDGSVSILDVLFNTGPDSRAYMKSFRAK